MTDEIKDQIKIAVLEERVAQMATNEQLILQFLSYTQDMTHRLSGGKGFNLGEVLTAALPLLKGVLDSMAKEDDADEGKEEVDTFTLSSFADGYASAKGRQDLADRFCVELAVQSELAGYAEKKFVEHQDRVEAAWVKILASQESEESAK